jgi:hypothetical protein
MLSNLHVTIVEARLIGEEDVDWYQERTVNSSLRNTKLTIVNFFFVHVRTMNIKLLFPSYIRHK